MPRAGGGFFLVVSWASFHGVNICFCSGTYSPAWSRCQSNEIGDISLQHLEFNAVPENNKPGNSESAKMGEIEEIDSVLQERSESSGKKKTPMCLVNELARHHKVF